MNIDLFVGREHEVKRIVEQASKGRSSLVIAEAGMGKTALLEVCSLILLDDSPVIEISRVQPFSSFLRELAEGLHEFGILKDDPKKALKAQGNNDDKAKFLLGLIEDYDGQLVLVIDDISGVTTTNRTWIEQLIDKAVVITSVVPKQLGKQGTKRLWKLFEEVRLEALNKTESGELLDILIERYNINAEDLELYKRKIIDAGQGSPFELTQMCKNHSAESIIKGTHLITLNETRVDTDQKGVAIVPILLLISPFAMVWRYVSRLQGDLDGYILSAIGMALMFVFIYFFRDSFKPRSS